MYWLYKYWLFWLKTNKINANEIMVSMVGMGYKQAWPQLNVFHLHNQYSSGHTCYMNPKHINKIDYKTDLRLKCGACLYL